MTLNISELENHTLLLTPNAQRLGLLNEHFNPSFLRQHKLITNTAAGRGVVYFFTLHSEQLVLRHYKRGGLMAKVSTDKFLFKGIAKARCYEELSVLQHLLKAKVNVPAPIAGRVRRSGLFYSADIITALIDNATELHEILQTRTVDVDVWQAIGVQIKKMHNAQVFHGDINVKNVMLSENAQVPTVHLLDFDKCEIRHGEHWKQANVLRFKRSLLKQLSKIDTYYYNSDHWDALLSGYNNA